MYKQKAYIYNKDSRDLEWKQIADMPNNHSNIWCGVVREDGEAKQVVLSGGMTYNVELNTWSVDTGKLKFNIF